MKRIDTTAMKWRLIPRVQDIGFFQGVLVSRGRLTAAALGSTALAFVLIGVVSDWMRHRSDSTGLDVLIIAFAGYPTYGLPKDLLATQLEIGTLRRNG